MKTKSTILVISLFLSVITFSALAAGGGTGINPTAVKMIRHMVLIPSFNDREFCGNYVVEIRDEKGQLVAPFKFFVPGTSQYVFFERVFDGEGIRTAIIRPFGHSEAACMMQVYAEPVTIKGVFEGGKTYRYFLQPKLVSNIKE